MTLNINPPKVLLTEEQVISWREEYATVQARASELQRLLSAAAVFFPATAPPLSLAPTPAPAEQMTVVDWVVRVVNAAGGKILSPKDIRKRIEQEGGELTSQNYLYTAIRRATESKLIKRAGDGYASLAQGSSEEEAGGQQ